jgi:penicillin-binding protein-related factor A (putative recombinase)
MAKNTGKNFENEIRKSLEKANLWWFRIQDTNDVSRFVKQAIAEKQPADFMAVYRSRPILIECKTTRNLSSFPLYYGSSRSIPAHQISMAQKAQRHGALAFIFIRRDEPRNKRVWAITPDQADYLYKKKDGKSINWKWFHAHAFELKKLKAPLRWEVISLIEANL